MSDQDWQTYCSRLVGLARNPNESTRFAGRSGWRLEALDKQKELNEESRQKKKQVVVPTKRPALVHENTKFEPIESLLDIHRDWWRLAPPDRSGIQYYTKCIFGKALYPVMLDTGSGVNSITESAMKDLVNMYLAIGKRIGDPGHPIRWLE